MGASAEGVERKVTADGFPATLTMPAGIDAAPAVLIIAGSGPTDRDGNNPLGGKASYLAKLAAALADRGVASLRYDKRGAIGGPPAGDESAVTFGTFVDDADTVLDWLQTRPELRSLMLMGHSEGGLVALELASARASVDGVVLLATPGRPPADTLRDQIESMPEPLHGQALEISAALEAGQAVDDVPAALLPLFRPSVQPFVRSLFALDPAGRLRQLRKPVLVVGGGKDLQVRRADFDALISARPDVASAWYPHMNHVLVDVAGGMEANIAAYSDPEAELAAGLADTIADFIKDSARR